MTCCFPYYENLGMLNRQYDMFRTLPKDMKANVALIVVDDGSPNNPAVLPNPSLGISFRDFKLFRMLDDVPWNQDACRNLAVSQSEDGWLLLTDIDHLIPHKTLRKALEAELDPNIAYQFLRVSEPDMSPYKPHPNSWMMTKALYNKIGGYDERFAAIAQAQGWKDGVYGTDGKFRKQITESYHEIKTFKMPLVRVPREVTPDASTTTYERRTPEMEARRTIVRDIIKNSGTRKPVTGLFPWERVG